MRPNVARTATILALAGAFALSACQDEGTEESLEVETQDLSGGELIAVPEDNEGVEVNLPDTPMTPVPVESGASTESE